MTENSEQAGRGDDGGSLPPIAVVLAPSAAVRRTISGYLKDLEVSAFCGGTVREAQHLVSRHEPAVVFIECAQYPLHVREIVALIRQTACAGGQSPHLVGLPSETCRVCEPRSCGLDAVAPSSPTLDEIGELLHRPSSVPAPDTALVDGGNARDAGHKNPTTELPPELQAALMKVFVDDTIERLARVHARLGQYELAEVGREAHAIKSGCLQIGESRLVAYCDRLRQAALDDDVCAAQRYYTELAAAFEGVTGHLAS